MKDQNPIRVIFADNDAVFRQEMTELLNREASIEVVAQVKSGQEVLETARKMPYDVVLLADTMPATDVFEATQGILEVNLEARVVLLIAFDKSETLHEALAAGARGIISKGASIYEIVSAINHVYRGEVFLDKKSLEMVMDFFIRTFPSVGDLELNNRIEALPKHLREIAYYLGRAYSNKEIAEATGLKESSVSTYVKQTLTRLEFRRKELLMAMARLGWRSD